MGIVPKKIYIQNWHYPQQYFVYYDQQLWQIAGYVHRVDLNELATSRGTTPTSNTFLTYALETSHNRLRNLT